MRTMRDISVLWGAQPPHVFSVRCSGGSAAFRPLHRPHCSDSQDFAESTGLQRGSGVNAALRPYAETTLNAYQPSRLHRSAPRRPDRVFGEGAEHFTRGACAPRHNGFTLVEIIAVVAVIAVLAAVITPSIIRRIDRAAWTAETSNLSNLGNALNQSIISNKSIPSATNWASAIAGQMSLPVSAVTTNSRRYARAFLIDPSLSINGAGLPYTQTTNGTTKPVSARVIIVSSLARALPASVTNGVASATNFTAIWNAAENTVPAGPAFAGWGGTGDDLRIKKVNLEPLFYRLILVDRTGATNTARYSIDTNTGTVAVPQGPFGLDKYYLDSTVVGLHDGTTNATVQARHLLKRSISFLFEAGTWRGQIQGDEQKYSATGSDFYNHTVTFLNRPTNPWSSQGASQVGVIIALYTFMFDYTFWANQCPHFDHHGNNVQSVPEYILLDKQGASSSGNIDDFSSHLITPP